MLARTLAKNVWIPRSSFSGCFLKASSNIMIKSVSRKSQVTKKDVNNTRDVRLPSPRRTCIMAVKTASLVGLDSSISSQSTRDSSTFWERTSANAFNAWGHKLEFGHVWQGSMKRTLTSSFVECFLSNLLQATMAALFEPVSKASSAE